MWNNARLVPAHRYTLQLLLKNLEKFLGKLDAL